LTDTIFFTKIEKDLHKINGRRFFNIVLNLAVPACFIGPAVMVITDVVTIALNHGINPIKQSISGFEAGPYGWLEKIGIITIAMSFLFISMNLLTAKEGQESRELKLGGVLLLIVAFGFLMTSLFNTHVIGTPMSYRGLIHRISFEIVSAAFYLFCLLFILLVRHRPEFKYFGIYTGLTFLVAIGFLVAIIVTPDVNDYFGLWERIITGFNLVWIAVVGPQVIKLSKARR
jgi:hypothetical protein